MKHLVATAAFLAFTAVSAQAAIQIGEVDPNDLLSSNKLFTSEWKRDRNVDNGGLGGQRGHDIFLRNGSQFAGPSSNLSWAGSGELYRWALSYDGDKASLTFGEGFSEMIDVNPDGNWNALQFFMRADSDRFETSTATVNIDKVNDTPTDGFSQSVTDGTLDKIFALGDFGTISSLSGTMRFDFEVAPGASGSPGSRLAINVKALEVAPVPVPAVLPAALAALGGLGLYARAQRRRTAA